VSSYEKSSDTYWLHVKWQVVETGEVKDGEYLESHRRLLKDCPDHEGRITSAISIFNEVGGYIEGVRYVTGSGDATVRGCKIISFLTETK